MATLRQAAAGKGALAPAASVNIAWAVWVVHRVWGGNPELVKGLLCTSLLWSNN
jgi:hypothetical protein